MTRCRERSNRKKKKNDPRGILGFFIIITFLPDSNLFFMTVFLNALLVFDFPSFVIK